MIDSANNPLRVFAPLRILVVDDDALLTKITSDHYTALGFDVRTAPDGASAMRMMEEQLPDIVLCDRKMPHVSGAELLEAIRARGPEWQQIVFVFVSALDNRRDIYAMMPLHPDGYLTKPIDFETEDRRLAEIMRKKRLAPAAP